VRTLALIATIVFVYALASRRLRSSVISAPMVFMAAGLVAEALGVSGLSSTKAAGTQLTHVGLLVVEVALALTLFTDAARIDFASLKRSAGLPARLLGLGLPLTIALGTAVAMLLFGGLSVWEAALLAAVLAPTDAALGQAVVSDTRVPARIRQALNVESGLNDGIAIWFITIFLTLAGSSELGTARDWLQFALEQLGFGTLVGAGVGVLGGGLVRTAARRQWATRSFERLAIVSLALIAFATADHIGGNGFIAAFVAGLAVGKVLGGRTERVLEFAEEEGQLVNLTVFFLFGAVAWHILGDLTWQVVVYAALSLTVVRIAPVALSLAGTSLRARTVLFAGWFGPRGLASIAYGLVIVEEQAGLHGARTIILVMTATVLASVIGHGAAAAPLSARYGRWSEQLPADAPELAATAEHATRLPFG
jgi:NhaP-type Na+/H+ or K+/H+ antiporter